MVAGLEDKEVTAIASCDMHIHNPHYLALTADGQVYSWGNGEGGRLGHGDTRSEFTQRRILMIVMCID